jgi:hypothetical protein
VIVGNTLPIAHNARQNAPKNEIPTPEKAKIIRLLIVAFQGVRTNPVVARLK